MALQNSIELNPAVALPGNVFYNPGYTRISAKCAGTVGAPAGDSGLFFGGAAFYDLASPDFSSVVPGAIGALPENFAGFLARNAYSENAIGSTHVVANGDSLGVLDKGDIYVVAAVAMAITDPVHLIINDANPENIGKITNAALGADVVDISPYVVMKGFTTGADQVVKVSVSKQ